MYEAHRRLILTTKCTSTLRKLAGVERRFLVCASSLPLRLVLSYGAPKTPRGLRRGRSALLLPIRLFYLECSGGADDNRCAECALHISSLTCHMSPPLTALPSNYHQQATSTPKPARRRGRSLQDALLCGCQNHQKMLSTSKYISQLLPHCKSLPFPSPVATHVANMRWPIKALLSLHTLSVRAAFPHLDGMA